MCAAVGDYRPERVLPKKLKRGGRESLELRLVQNPDLLAGIGARRRGAAPMLVGFAVETGTDAEIVKLARGKLVAKGVDVVIANPAGESLGREDNRVLIVGKGRVETLDVLPKPVVASRIMSWIEEHLPSPAAPSSRTAAKSAEPRPARPRGSAARGARVRAAARRGGRRS
jgi:phosphopantothenoylcysteine decarboxylase/phosphopantothenate--cysteine ligase